MFVCVHLCEGVQLYDSVGHVYIYDQVDSAGEAAASTAAGKSRRENELERQLEYAHARVTYCKGTNFHGAKFSHFGQNRGD